MHNLRIVVADNAGHAARVAQIGNLPADIRAGTDRLTHYEWTPEQLAIIVSAAADGTNQCVVFSPGMDLALQAGNLACLAVVAHEVGHLVSPDGLREGEDNTLLREVSAWEWAREYLTKHHTEGWVREFHDMLIIGLSSYTSVGYCKLGEVTEDRIETLLAWDK